MGIAHYNNNIDNNTKHFDQQQQQSSVHAADAFKKRSQKQITTRASQPSSQLTKPTNRPRFIFGGHHRRICISIVKYIKKNIYVWWLLSIYNKRNAAKVIFTQNFIISLTMYVVFVLLVLLLYVTFYERLDFLMIWLFCYCCCCFYFFYFILFFVHVHFAFDVCAFFSSSFKYNIYIYIVLHMSYIYVYLCVILFTWCLLLFS